MLTSLDAVAEASQVTRPVHGRPACPQGTGRQSRTRRPESQTCYRQLAPPQTAYTGTADASPATPWLHGCARTATQSATHASPRYCKPCEARPPLRPHPREIARLLEICTAVPLMLRSYPAPNAVATCENARHAERHSQSYLLTTIASGYPPFSKASAAQLDRRSIDFQTQQHRTSDP